MKEIRELSSKLNETLKDISQKELSEIGYKASQDFISAIDTEQKSEEIQFDAKWELFKKNRENKREANKQIRIHEIVKQNVTDNRIIAICDDIINLKKEELESIDIKEVELREEMRILLNGGKLKSLVDEEKLLEEKPLEESNPEEKPVEEVINAFPDLQIPNGELPPEPTNEEANQFPPLTPPSDEPDIRENEPLLSNEEADESEDNKEESEDKEEAIIPLPGNDAEREATFKDAKPKLKEKVKDVLEKVAPWLMTFVTIAALTIGTISDSIKPKDNIEDIRPPVIEQTVTVDQEPPLEDISDMSNVTENKDEIVSEENETPVQEESVVDTNEVHPKTDNEFYLAPGDFVVREDKETGDIESTVDYYGTQRDGEGNEIGTAEVDKTPGNYTVIEREDVPTEEETQSINNSDIEFFTNSYWEGMFGTSDETQGKSK